MVNIITRLGRRYTVAEMARAYHLSLSTPSGKDFVLPDILEFTGALDPAPNDPSDFNQGRAAGRRDVWLHIMKRVCMSDEEQIRLYAGRSTISQQDFKRG